MEKRRSVRTLPDEGHPIRVDINGDDFLEIAHAVDIGESGIGLASSNCLEGCHLDEAVTVVLTLPWPVGKTVKFDGKIKHISDNRFGVAYTDITEADHNHLRRYIRHRTGTYQRTTPPVRRRRRRVLLAISTGTVILAMTAAIGWMVYSYTFESHSPSFPAGDGAPAAERSPEAPPSITPSPAQEKPDSVEHRSVPLQKADTVSRPLPDSAPLPAVLIAGSVAIVDPYGRIITKIRTAATKNGWIALPTSLCYGGARWNFESDRGPTLPVAAGVWQEDQMLSIWQIDGAPFQNARILHPMDRDSPVQWQALDQADAVDVPTPSVNPGVDFFLSADRSVMLVGAGVFKQGDRIVGWTFDELPGKAYFWAGPPGDNLYPKISVDNFYTITFANGREEQFARAMAAPHDASLVDRLSAFAEGFLLQPSLTENQRPEFVQQASVIGQMEPIVSRLMQNGQYAAVADILGQEAIVSELNDALQSAVIYSTAQAYGNNEAITMAETIGNRPASIEHILKKLYSETIRAAISQNDFTGGHAAVESARSAFPEDPVIYLLAVELALARGRWQEAASLLSGRSFPEQFNDRLFVLENRIERLKREDTGIRLPMDPRSGFAKADVLLGGSIRQEMILDTGASLVTIPTATAAALGIIISTSTPKRYVQTAAGPVLSHEVVIPSISLGNVTIYNVRALVLRSNQTSLLGNNFLKYFDMESDPARGSVYLFPKQ